ncbi:MAG: glycerate kinase [Lachnospiraceae bacterium]|nr:glycerate kinase [Lachnospiraceae bacterium]
MNRKLRADADYITEQAIAAVLPDRAVKRALEGVEFPGRVILIAAGKAAWQMAKAAHEQLSDRIDAGIVITKYGHVKGPIGKLECVEAGHPIPDENSFSGTEKAIKLVQGLSERDTVVFLLSGGGSALFEKPLIPAQELGEITEKLLASGASITEINTVRKRLSAVKGGKFAVLARPARIFSVVLSDILGDPLDMIASGPACPDSTTCAQALEVARRYGIELSDEAGAALETETPKSLDNVTTKITGSVKELCTAAMQAAKDRGYRAVYLTDRLCCEARDAGSFLASVLKSHAEDGEKLAFIAGGETVVHLRGKGRGGRNQELALAAGRELSGEKGMAVFSVGSDGTDGPTDAAGGYADGDTASELSNKGIDIFEALKDNDSYPALKQTGGLIMTGPTGTNVNDVAVALLDV